jgi:cephalosporin hydroxylase
MTDPIQAFQTEVAERIHSYGSDKRLQRAATEFMIASTLPKYSYNFAWLGRPIIQYPQDIVAMQELIWTTRPDLIIETGIAHGGSLIFSASMLALLDMSDAAREGTSIDPRQPRRRVLGVDIDIRAHNRDAIEAHPMRHRIEMIQGSSIDPAIVERVRARARDFERVLVCLDSNHTHDHVLAELEAYAGLTTPGSYCCVFDTVVEDLPAEAVPDRPWAPGNSPKTAAHEFLRRLRDEGRVASDGLPLQLEIDPVIEGKLLLTVAPDGYLKRPAG